MFFLFKQKTAYEMRISDWSSDVCSSDLGRDQEARSAALLFLGDRLARSSEGIQPDAERHFLLGRDVDHRGLELLDQVGEAFGRPGTRHDLGDFALLVLRDLRADRRLGDQRQRGAAHEQGRSDAIYVTHDSDSSRYKVQRSRRGSLPPGG